MNDQGLPARTCAFACWLIVFAATCQWLAVAMQLEAAWHQWLHFKDYGGGGHITAGSRMTQLFFGLSLALVALAWVLHRAAANRHPRSARAAVVGGAMLLAGALVYGALLISPRAELVR